MSEWVVYILECKDKTLYTGITSDIKRRIEQHNAGKGAKYTMVRRPVKLLITFEMPSRSEAMKREYQIKQMTRKEKLLLIKNKKNG